MKNDDGTLITDKKDVSRVISRRAIVRRTRSRQTQFEKKIVFDIYISCYHLIISVYAHCNISLEFLVKINKKLD